MERTKGLVIKQSDYGEGNRMLTVFTEDYGIVKAAIYGVKRAKSRQAAASQFLSWAEFMLYFGKGEVATVNSVTAEENFFPIQEDLQKLALSSYLAEITYFSQTLNFPNTSVLHLLLNTLHVLAYRNMPIKKAKAVFELRIAKDMGYMPVLGECSACGEEGVASFFSCECGGGICEKCHARSRDDLPLSPAAYYAMCYVLTAEDKKVFSFDISEEALSELAEVSEKYLVYKMERNFPSLDYLKKII